MCVIFTSVNNIGKRVREARHAKGLTLRQVADRSGLSVGFLSQVERGVSDPRVVSLFAISEALGVVPAALLGENGVQDVQEPEVGASLVVSTAGSCLSLEVPDWPVTYKWLSGPRSPLGGEMCIAAFPRNTQLPPAQHAGEEFAYVLKGTVLVRAGDSESRLSAGDSFQLRGSEPHSVCTEDEEAEVLFFQTVKYTEWGAAQALQARPQLAAEHTPARPRDPRVRREGAISKPTRGKSAQPNRKRG